MGLELNNPWLLVLFPAALCCIAWLNKGARRSLKTRVTVFMRALVALLCVLALAAPQVVRTQRQNEAWVLLDVSDSTKALRAQMTDSLKTALGTLKDDQQAGVIAFGRDAMVEVSLSKNPLYIAARTAVDAGATNVQAALTLSKTLSNAENPRAVLLSDGRFSMSDNEIASLAASGMTVDGVQFSLAQGKDAQVSGVALPALVYQGQTVNITVTLSALSAMQGTLVLYQNGTPAFTREVTLRGGENSFVFQTSALSAGTVTYTAKWLSAQDTESRNNALSALTRVTGAPSVLLVAGALGEADELSKLLQASGMTTEIILPSQLPTSAEAFRAYDAVALCNVDFGSASEESFAALSTAVRSLGVGLFVAGGDSSYALGGYRGTVLEDMLPVSMDVKNKMNMPALSLVLAIDKSGSMTEAQFGTARLELAKEAAMRAAEVLNERDQIGVIAFDDAAKWVVPLQKAKDAAEIQRLIGTIRPGGGTAFYSPLLEALTALSNTDTPQKHIILLSDGDPGDTGFADLVKQMAQRGITLTCVAVGSGANTALMRTLSQAGGGRFYASDQFSDLPKIFTKETYLVSGSYVQNRAFTPVIAQKNTLTDFAGFPLVEGYLTTSEKPLSETSLMTDEDDPLLSAWQYGAGRVAAWTSDVSGAWTGALLSWKDAPAFFSGIVASVFSQEKSAGTLTTTLQNGTLNLLYERADKAQAEGSVEVTAVLPDGAQTLIPLRKTGAGVYEGELPATLEGAYALRAVDTFDGEEHSTDGGASVPYLSEYDLRLNQNGAAFERLVSLTGGTMYAPGDPYLSFTGGQTRSRQSLTPLLTLLTLIFLLMDIALRRLPWELALEKRLSEPEKPADAEIKKPAAPKPKPKKDAPAPSQTADALLSSLRDKKKL